jgi:hypothetical protein
MLGQSAGRFGKGFPGNGRRTGFVSLKSVSLTLHRLKPSAREIVFLWRRSRLRGQSSSEPENIRFEYKLWSGGLAREKALSWRTRSWHGPCTESR